MVVKISPKFSLGDNIIYSPPGLNRVVTRETGRSHTIFAPRDMWKAGCIYRVLERTGHSQSYIIIKPGGSTCLKHESTGLELAEDRNDVQWWLDSRRNNLSTRDKV